MLKAQLSRKRYFMKVHDFLKKFVVIFLILFSFFSCTKSSVKIIKTNSEKKGMPLKIHFTKGQHWMSKQKMAGLISIKITPQIAVWIEDLEGNLIENIYITNKFAKQKWGFIKYDPDKPERTSSLPYWINKLI